MVIGRHDGLLWRSLARSEISAAAAPQSLDIFYRDVGSASMAHACPGLAVIGSYVRTCLDSTDHGRQVLLEIYEMVLAEQDRRSAVLSGLDHQDLAEVYQDFS